GIVDVFMVVVIRFIDGNMVGLIIRAAPAYPYGLAGHGYFWSLEGGRVFGNQWQHQLCPSGRQHELACRPSLIGHAYDLNIMDSSGDFSHDAAGVLLLKDDLTGSAMAHDPVQSFLNGRAPLHISGNKLGLCSLGCLGVCCWCVVTGCCMGGRGK